MASGVTVSEEVKAAYRDFKKSKKGTYIIFKLDEKFEKIVIDKIGPEVKSQSEKDRLMEQQPTYENEFIQYLHDANENRYGFYDFRFEVPTDSGAVIKSKIFLVNWNPDDAKIKAKMVYASSAQSLLKELGETKKFNQCSCVTDLDYGAITKDFMKSDRTN